MDYKSFLLYNSIFYKIPHKGCMVSITWCFILWEQVVVFLKIYVMIIILLWIPPYVTKIQNSTVQYSNLMHIVSLYFKIMQVSVSNSWHSYSSQIFNEKVFECCKELEFDDRRLNRWVVKTRSPNRFTPQNFAYS